MPGTVDDFIQRFGGATTIDDREASQYYDRFASTRPEDTDFDNDTMSRGTTEYLGQLPPDQFQQAASSAFTQAPPPQRQGLLSGLLSGLQGRGVDPGSLQSRLGLGSLNPNQMGAHDYARLADYARTNHPDVMQRQVAEQPWLVKAMGNPFVMGALGVVASRMIRKRR